MDRDVKEEQRQGDGMRLRTSARHTNLGFKMNTIPCVCMWHEVATGIDHP